MTDNTNSPTLNQLAALDSLYVILLEISYPQQPITKAYGVAQNRTAAEQETEWLNHLWEGRHKARLYQSDPRRWVEIAYHEQVAVLPEAIRASSVGPFPLILETDPEDRS